MTDLDATLAAIDDAISCQHCTGPLDGSPSPDFCSEECQTAWHTARAQPLVGYQEPWQRIDAFPGVGGDRARWRPPDGASSGDDARSIADAIHPLVDARGQATLSAWVAAYARPARRLPWFERVLRALCERKATRER